ncbi:MAG: methyltransferase domain-containing protein [Anaerolineaceae bacterium]|nr:methyltransferase domain-containing protein [Anaerolineaceae bacterium]
MPAQPSIFDSFQPYYEIMIDWDKRLAHESPFFQRAFQSVHARRVLDCACGTGQHACLFACWGLEATGADISQEMILKSRHLAESRNLQIDFRRTSFDHLSEVFDKPFQATVCAGNSLSLAGKRSVVEAAIKEMAGLTTPDGALIIQVLNYERFPPGRNVYSDPVAREHIGQNYIFMKTFRRAGTTCEMDIVVLQSGPSDTWTRTVFSEHLLVLDKASLVAMAERAGFPRVKLYGGYGMGPFNPRTSRDLIMVARKE